MIESNNEVRGIRDGIFLGYWSGYKCWVTIAGKKYEWDVPDGIRGISRQVIRVRKGKAFIDEAVTWNTNEVPELDFKTIKVVYVFEGSIKTIIKSVPLRWKYTAGNEYELADEIGILPESIINILEYK